MISSGPVEDRLAIRELVESYNDAVMRFDAEAWAANWRDDATWALPGTGDGITGKANVVPMWQNAMSGFSFVGFFASAGPITVPGSPAVVAPSTTVASPGRTVEFATRLSRNADRPLITAVTKRASAGSIDTLANVSTTALLALG